VEPVQSPETSLSHHAVRAAWIGAVAWTWVGLFSVPALVAQVHGLVARASVYLPNIVAWEGWDEPLIGPVKVVAAVLVVVVVALGVHGARRTGLLGPTTTGWRLTALAVAVAAFLQAWLGAELSIERVDIGVGRPDPWVWLAVDAVLVVAELVLATAVLALALPFGLPPVDERRRTGLPGMPWLAGLGVGGLQDARLAGPRTLFAVPLETWPAIFVQAVVFATLQTLPVDAPVGASVAGGIAGGWLTVRTGSIWPAVVVRLVTSHLGFVVVRLLLSS
jgi:hypothetical protein